MQPYVFPYLGYFKLINAVDRFIVLDDVNYIKRGWINRNRILVNGREYLFTIPITAVSQNKKINEVFISEKYPVWKEKFLRTMKRAYCKAPYFSTVMDLLHEILIFPEKKLSFFLSNSLKEICGYLHINTQLIKTSAIYEKRDFKGEERIIDICKQNQAKEYLNLPGGNGLYSKSRFQRENILLRFIDSSIPPYKQGKNEFIPNLSILDVMMFNDKEKIMNMMKSKV
jgi:hypothetical protein